MVYSPWNSPDQDTGVGSLSLLQQIFPTLGLNLGLPCRQILYQLSHKWSPRILGWVSYPFSRGSSWSRSRTEVSCIAGGFFTNWAIREGDKSSQQLWDTSHDPVLDVQEGQWVLHKLSTRGKNGSHFLLRFELGKVFTPMIHISSVQLLSRAQPFWDPMDCSTPEFPVHHQLPELTKLMSIESVMPSNHFILCRPLLLLPSIFPSIRVFSKESILHIRWPKYWSFSFSISPSDEHSGLISFRMDWLDLLAVQGTLKSLPQNHSSKASILLCSTFFIVQLSHPYMTTGKTIALPDRPLLAK